MATIRSSSRLADSIKATGRKIDYYKEHPLARRLQIMKRAGINLVLDVGANIGQYAKIARKAGFAGQIVSFEPLTQSYSRLARSAARDPRWTAVHLGLGSRDHESVIHISGDSQASSLVKMLPRHEEIAPYFSRVGEERISIRKLDTVWDEHVPEGSKVYLKIDTQGFEKQVLQGAARSLARIQIVQLEISILPLYEGTWLLPDVLKHMQRRGLTLVSLEYGFCHPETGQMLQVDGVFART
jgi:FkbM family methyltransferase